MKRVIINVAIGEPYTAYQDRLIESIKKYGYDYISWKDELPINSKSHETSMYGFKMYAFQEAFKKGYESVLWLDSPTEILGNIDFIFEEIEKHGEVAYSTDAKLYKYCNDETLKYFNIDRHKVKDLNWSLNFGFVFGFTENNSTYKKMFECERLGLFTSREQDYQDHLTNSNILFNGEYVEHRHEESIISMIIQSEGRKLNDINDVIKQLKWIKDFPTYTS